MATHHRSYIRETFNINKKYGPSVLSGSGETSNSEQAFRARPLPALMGASERVPGIVPCILHKDAPHTGLCEGSVEFASRVRQNWLHTKTHIVTSLSAVRSNRCVVTADLCTWVNALYLFRPRVSCATRPRATASTWHDRGGRTPLCLFEPRANCTNETSLLRAGRIGGGGGGMLPGDTLRRSSYSFQATSAIFLHPIGLHIPSTKEPVQLQITASCC